MPKGEYLSDVAFFASPNVEKNYVKFVSVDTKESNGDRTLATLTFQVVDLKTSALVLSQVSLADLNGQILFPCVENGTVEDAPAVESVYLAEDVNNDGIVNIQDLVLISSSLGKTGKNKVDVNSDGVVNIHDLVRVAKVMKQ